MKLLKLLFLLILSIPASAQIQLGADIDGEAPGDGLSKVSISSDGELLAIGMPLSEGDSSYFRSGRVKVYQYNNGNWSQFGGAIDGQQSSETFGSSLALSADSNILAIGAVGYNYNQGALRVYRFNSGSWNQLGNDIIGEKPYSYFINKYAKAYDANKAHSKNNFLYWTKYKNIEYMIKDIKKKNLDDIADSCNMILAWIFMKSKLI